MTSQLCLHIYSHLNTPIDQWQRAYSLEYFINKNTAHEEILKIFFFRTDLFWYNFAFLLEWTLQSAKVASDVFASQLTILTVQPPTKWWFCVLKKSDTQDLHQLRHIQGANIRKGEVHVGYLVGDSSGDGGGIKTKSVQNRAILDFSGQKWLPE